MFTLTDEDAGPQTHIICVAGELDAATHAPFDALVDRVTQSGKRRLIIDLTDATFMDSTALSSLLAAARHLRRPAGVLAVVLGDHAQPRARFDLTGTGEILNVCDSREEALALVEHEPDPEPAPDAPLRLRLYVNGRSPNASRAEVALDALRARLPAGADVEVVDISARPDVAEAKRLLATPALVRDSPPPVRRIIGDLSDHEQVLYALDLR